MTKTKEYSLWLIPSGVAYNRLEKVISELSQQYSTPYFTPHLTLLGGLTDAEAELIEKAKELSACTPALEFNLKTINFSANYFKAMFIRANKTTRLIKFNAKARKIFGSPRTTAYNPHISLMYGESNATIKRKVTIKIGNSFPLKFKINNFYLFDLNGEIKDWHPIKEFKLKDT